MTLLLRVTLLILTLLAVLLGGLLLYAHLATADTIRLRHTVQQEREVLVNIDPALDTHRIDAVWILRPDRSEIHGMVRRVQHDLHSFPLPPDTLRQLTAGGEEAHCFVQTQAGLLELRSGPIRPSDPEELIPAPYS